MLQPWADLFEKPFSIWGKGFLLLAALLRMAESDFLSPGSRVIILSEQPEFLHK